MSVKVFSIRGFFFHAEEWEVFFGRRPSSVIRKSRTWARGVIQVGFVIPMLQFDIPFFSLFSFLNWIQVPNCGCSNESDPPMSCVN